MEYEEIRKEIIGDADDDEEAEGEGGEEGEEGGEDEEKLKAAESKKRASNLFYGQNCEFLGNGLAGGKVLRDDKR